MDKAVKALQALAQGKGGGDAKEALASFQEALGPNADPKTLAALTSVMGGSGPNGISLDTLMNTLKGGSSGLAGDNMDWLKKIQGLVSKAQNQASSLQGLGNASGNLVSSNQTGDATNDEDTEDEPFEFDNSGVFIEDEDLLGIKSHSKGLEISDLSEEASDDREEDLFSKVMSFANQGAKTSKRVQNDTEDGDEENLYKDFDIDIPKSQTSLFGGQQPFSSQQTDNNGIDWFKKMMKRVKP